MSWWREKRRRNNSKRKIRRQKGHGITTAAGLIQGPPGRQDWPHGENAAGTTTSHRTTWFSVHGWSVVKGERLRRGGGFLQSKLIRGFVQEEGRARKASSGLLIGVRSIAWRRGGSTGTACFTHSGWLCLVKHTSPQESNGRKENGSFSATEGSSFVERGGNNGTALLLVVEAVEKRHFLCCVQCIGMFISPILEGPMHDDVEDGGVPGNYFEQTGRGRHSRRWQARPAITQSTCITFNAHSGPWRVGHPVSKFNGIVATLMNYLC